MVKKLRILPNTTLHVIVPGETRSREQLNMMQIYQEEPLAEEKKKNMLQINKTQELTPEHPLFDASLFLVST